MPTEDKARELAGKFAKEALLEYLEAKSLELPEDIRYKHQIIAYLKRTRSDLHEELEEIAELRKGLKKRHLKLKLKELGIGFLEDEKLTVFATRLFVSEGKRPFAELRTIANIERTRSFATYVAGEPTELPPLNELENTLRSAIPKELSEGKWRAILDQIAYSSEDEALYIRTGYEYSDRLVREIDETGEAIRVRRFRPLAGLTAVLSPAVGELEISCRSQSRKEKGVRCLSKALTGRSGTFKPMTGDPEKLSEDLLEERVKESLESQNVRMVNLILRNVGLPGNPQRISLTGDDLFETIAHMDRKRLNLLKLGEPEQVKFIFEDESSVTVTPEDGNATYTGRTDVGSRLEIRSWLKENGWLG